MTEEEHYSEIDVSDIIEDTDNNILENDYCIKYEGNNVESNIQDSEIANSEDHSEKKIQNSHKSEAIRTTKLPIGRIKNIMKMDPDVHVISAEAVFLVAKATVLREQDIRRQCRNIELREIIIKNMEMFLETLAKETFVFTSQHKRKTIAKKDLDVVINKVDCLCFLEGAMDF